MGIITAFVNQIGREVARDVYRGVKSSVNSSATSLITPSDFNTSFLLKVTAFKRLASEEETLRHIVNYVEEAENTAVDNLDWLDIFTELDNKIEFCKAELGTASQGKLSFIDDQNQKTFNLKLEEHKVYISENIAALEAKVAQSPNYTIGILLSFLCCNPIYYKAGLARIVSTFMLVLIILFFGYWAYFCFVNAEIIAQPVTAEGIKAMKFLAFLFFSLSFLLYIGIVYRSVKRANEARLDALSNQNILSKLKHYLETIRTSDHTL
jgi:hypothetical protein